MIFVNPLIMSFYGLSKTLDRRRSRAEVRQKKRKVLFFSALCYLSSFNYTSLRSLIVKLNM